LIFVPEYIEKLKPYRSGNSSAGRMSKEDFAKLINLASNENHLPISENVKQAIIEAIANSAKYPEPSAKDLRNKLAEKFNKTPEQFVAGNGSDSLIGYIFNAFTQEGNEILSSEGTFIGAYVNANKMGRKLKLVPLNNYHIDLEAIVKAISKDTKIIYIANPNNPTGTTFNKIEFENFLAKVPTDIIIVLDEAYSLYAEKFDDYPRGMSYENDNLIILQTLSKTYGLAGMRVGYSYSSNAKLIDYIQRVKLPFEPNYFAQVAAITALSEDSYINQTLDINTKTLLSLRKCLEENNIEYTGGYANFLMMLFENELEASRFTDYMFDGGIIVRQLQMFGINNGVRISTGLPQQIDKAIELINSFK